MEVSLLLVTFGAGSEMGFTLDVEYLYVGLCYSYGFSRKLVTLMRNEDFDSGLILLLSVLWQILEWNGFLFHY